MIDLLDESGPPRLYGYGTGVDTEIYNLRLQLHRDGGIVHAAMRIPSRWGLQCRHAPLLPHTPTSVVEPQQISLNPH